MDGNKEPLIEFVENSKDFFNFREIFFGSLGSFLKYHLKFLASFVRSFGSLGCSQVVRQLVLVQCTVGSNPTTPAKKIW